MDRFAQKLRSFPVVGLDTSLFIYHFEANPTYVSLTNELFLSIEQGRCSGVTSSITLMEILVRPFALGHQEIAQKYEALLVNFPHLEIVDLNRDIIRQAARLRAEINLRPPDALQVSACMARSAQALITNDRQLERVKKHIEVLVLDDFIHHR